MLTEMVSTTYKTRRPHNWFPAVSIRVRHESRDWQISGVDAGAGQAIGGYRRGAAEARGGVDQNDPVSIP
jgi:hypothetical protein